MAVVMVVVAAMMDTRAAVDINNLQPAELDISYPSLLCFNYFFYSIIVTPTSSRKGVIIYLPNITNPACFVATVLIETFYESWKITFE
jgi:hypothetical protein